MKPNNTYQNGFNNMTESALSDVNNIADFISRNSEFYAKRFVKKLIDATLKLESFPEIGNQFVNCHNQIIGKLFLRNIGSSTEYSPQIFITVHHSAMLLENNENLGEFFDR